MTKNPSEAPKIKHVHLPLTPGVYEYATILAQEEGYPDFKTFMVHFIVQHMKGREPVFPSKTAA